MTTARRSSRCSSCRGAVSVSTAARVSGSVLTAGLSRLGTECGRAGRWPAACGSSGCWACRPAAGTTRSGATGTTRSGAAGTTRSGAAGTTGSGAGSTAVRRCVRPAARRCPPAPGWC
ncbi:hypothetical protein C7E17_02795 [Stenotrophomonas maltophilia]|nr:hypothetical protein C7E17_02795 [Stenotrophomonas maltophilia]